MKWNNIPRALIVLFFAAISLYFLYTLISSTEILGIQTKDIRDFLEKNRTLGTIIISSPVAFIIWYFRDQNATKQIENQRKDINLKEFQKIAEWVSGLHLIEDEITEKTATKDGKSELETTTKYTQQNNVQSIPSFSKRDGAVGLQIAAIHSLLPFFRGEHGESFRRPALNLLTSAWISLQQKDLAILEAIDVLKSPDKFDTQIKKIQNNAKSPIGVALTQVLLSDGGDNLLEFPEVFPNLCLAGMDFHLPGLDKEVLSLFIKKKQDCSRINLVGCNLESINFREANLQGAKLNNANLYFAWLNEANLWRSELNKTNLCFAKLNKANLRNANLNEAILLKTNLNGSKLGGGSLVGCDLTNSILNETNLYKTILNGSIINIEQLSGKNINVLKEQGAIILYGDNELEYPRPIIFKNKRSEESYVHFIGNLTNIGKILEENPDWEITIENIKE